MNDAENFVKTVRGYGYGSGKGNGEGYGYGYGFGHSSGYGKGNGDGIGYGDGSGYGSGDGYASGNGYASGKGSYKGYGSGSGDFDDRELVEYNGNKVFYIDDVPTIIFSVHGNYAKGAIIHGDLTSEKCFIAKSGNCFAHGKTLHEAKSDADRKWMKNMPVEERIKMFINNFPSLEMKALRNELFEWHGILTGSCLLGRKTFCMENGINLDGNIKIVDFIELTRHTYGGCVIEKLLSMYKEKDKK